MNEILTGLAAIEHARETGRPLNKYADPTEGAREGLTVAEAEAIAAEDPSLIWFMAEEVDDDEEFGEETNQARAKIRSAIVQASANSAITAAEADTLLDMLERVQGNVFDEVESEFERLKDAE